MIGSLANAPTETEVNFRSFIYFVPEPIQSERVVSLRLVSCATLFCSFVLDERTKAEFSYL